MNFPNFTSSILQPISTPEWTKRNLSVFVKRDDLIHPEISGNKWRKLTYNIQEARFRKNKTIITFGGAYSNHLVATAVAGKLYGFSTIGIVRGDELNEKSNETLRCCAKNDMRLLFISRSEYFLKADSEYLRDLHHEFQNSFIVPEGGANYYGIIGCQDIWKELPKDLDHLFVAQGTTTTSCGLLLGCSDNCIIHGVPVLKGFHSISEMSKLLSEASLGEEIIQSLINDKFKMEGNYHFGGYGKYSMELLQYIKEKYRQMGLKLDPIYTAKSFYAMEDYISKEDLQNQKIVFIHTGGLQGCKSVEEKEKITLFE